MNVNLGTTFAACFSLPSSKQDTGLSLTMFPTYCGSSTSLRAWPAVELKDRVVSFSFLLPYFSFYLDLNLEDDLGALFVNDEYTQVNFSPCRCWSA